MDLQAVLSRLHSLAPELKEAGVRSLFVFGSVARGESDAASDVDLAVEFSRPIGLFEFSGLKLRLEEVLGCKVDLVMPSGLRPEVRDSLMRDAVRAA